METNSKNTAGKIVLLIFLLICSGLGIAAFSMSFRNCKKDGFNFSCKGRRRWGYSCDMDWNCCSNRCDDSWETGNCYRVSGDNGKGCCEDSDCKSNHCQSNTCTCVAVGENGDKCHLNEECKSGKCGLN